MDQADNTAAIIDEYAAQHSWIRPVHRLNRGFRKAGGGVGRSIHDGYRALSTDNCNLSSNWMGSDASSPTISRSASINFQRDPH